MAALRCPPLPACTWSCGVRPPLNPAMTGPSECESEVYLGIALRMPGLSGCRHPRGSTCRRAFSSIILWNCRILKIGIVLPDLHRLAALHLGRSQASRHPVIAQEGEALCWSCSVESNQSISAANWFQNELFDFSTRTWQIKVSDKRLEAAELICWLHDETQPCFKRYPYQTQSRQLHTWCLPCCACWLSCGKGDYLSVLRMVHAWCLPSQLGLDFQSV